MHAWLCLRPLRCTDINRSRSIDCAAPGGQLSLVQMFSKSIEQCRCSRAQCSPLAGNDADFTLDLWLMQRNESQPCKGVHIGGQSRQQADTQSLTNQRRHGGRVGYLDLNPVQPNRNIASLTEACELGTNAGILRQQQQVIIGYCLP